MKSLTERIERSGRKTGTTKAGRVIAAIEKASKGETTSDVLYSQARELVSLGYSYQSVAEGICEIASELKVPHENLSGHNLRAWLLQP